MQSSDVRPAGHADALVNIEVVERSLLLLEACKDRQLARRVLVAKFVVAVILAVVAIVFGAVGIPIAAGSAGGGCALASVGGELDPLAHISEPISMSSRGAGWDAGDLADRPMRR
jgi:hypothetical protein